MKVLIAGAGIGGLTAALCLQQAGHEVQIFEQAAEFSEVGAGLQCGANALRVMDHLGLPAKLEAVAVDPLRADFRDHKTGKTLYSMAFGEAYRHQHGSPYLHIHRADLHTALANALIERAPAAIELNARVTDYEESDNKVRVILADQRTFKGDCLVACDGVRSAIRSQLFFDDSKPEAAAPQYTGCAAWRGVLPADRLPENFMEKIVSNFIGPDKHMVIYYLRKQQLVNFVGIVENNQWTNSSWIAKAPWEELQADFAGWHPTVQAVIDAVDRDQCYRWALCRHQPFTNWSSGRVTLLGDAAHSTLPYMASGAAMAIEDARILQRALDQAPDVAAALQLYQRNRFERTAKIQSMSTQAGKLYHINNKALLRLAFMGLRTLRGRQEAFLPAYDANTVELI